MDLRRQLTTEVLGKKFNNSFELVSHAIDLAKRMLAAGYSIEGTEDVRNQAYQILTKILHGDEEIRPIAREERASHEPTQSEPEVAPLA